MDWVSSLVNIRVDQKILLDVGHSMQRLRMYPYFDLAHYILTISSLREDLGPGYSSFSRRQPLICWISSMLVCFAGSFLANFLLGEPVVAVFKKQEDIILATIVWYLIFYAPFDCVYKLSNFLPVGIVLSVLKECQRAYKIHHGVAYAARLYPNGHIIQILVGTAKGSGTGVVRTFGQLLLRGSCIPLVQSDFIRPSFTAKACIFCSTLLTIHKSGLLVFNLPQEIMYLGIVLFFVYFKMSAILFNVHDPLAPFENLFCAIFMGGIWDALSRAISAAASSASGDQRRPGTDGVGSKNTVSSGANSATENGTTVHGNATGSMDHGKKVQ